jgi:hypothetical protein
MSQERATISNWERNADLAWLAENLEVFCGAAQSGFEQAGRGALAIDLTNPLETGGYPAAYWPQSYVDEFASQAVARVVQTYDPENDVVIMLLKAGEKMSIYRLRKPE